MAGCFPGWPGSVRKGDILPLLAIVSLPSPAEAIGGVTQALAMSLGNRMHGSEVAWGGGQGTQECGYWVGVLVEGRVPQNVGKLDDCGL